MTEAAATCARHREASAVGVCGRCGGFTCPACTVPHEGREVCPGCLVQQAAQARASRRARLALGLGIAGLSLGCVPGVVALVLARQELDAIARGEAPRAGRALAHAAHLLGWANVGLLAVGLTWVLLSG